MANQPVTPQQLINANADCKTLEDAANGAPEVEITSRLGRKFWTLATFNSRSQKLLIDFQAAINTIVLDDGVPAQIVSINGTTLDAFLNTKADKANTYTKSETYTKNEVNAQLSNLVGGSSKFYPTLAQANADIANIAVNTTVTTGDSGVYYKATEASTTLTKSPYDPVAVSNTYTDNKISQIPKPSMLEILSGEDAYNKALENPAEIFSVIWREYNKPIYHIGNGVFVDVTGVTVVPYSVVNELVFTIKTRADNETFIYPTRDDGVTPISMTVDWGDGQATTHTNFTVNHTYTAPTGSEFQIKVTGETIPFFDFGSANAGRRTSRLSLQSVDKNTLPARSMAFFSIEGCDNIKYIGPSAFQSFSGTTLKLGLTSYENVTFHKDAFKGLGHVINIDSLLGGTASNGLYTLPEGLLDHFTGVTSAVSLFRKLNSALPIGILDKMVNLENIATMFYESKITTIDNRIFKNQTKLKNVTQVFRLSNSLVADAFQLYTDMNQGSPTTVNGCFANVPAMTNLTSVPAAWKTI